MASTARYSATRSAVISNRRYPEVVAVLMAAILLAGVGAGHAISAADPAVAAPGRALRVLGTLAA